MKDSIERCHILVKGKWCGREAVSWEIRPWATDCILPTCNNHRIACSSLKNFKTRKEAELYVLERKLYG